MQWIWCAHSSVLDLSQASRSATKETVARHNICGVNDGLKDGMSCLLAAWGDNEDAFPRVQVVAIEFALLFEANEELSPTSQVGSVQILLTKGTQKGFKSD